MEVGLFLMCTDSLTVKLSVVNRVNDPVDRAGSPLVTAVDMICGLGVEGFLSWSTVRRRS